MTSEMLEKNSSCSVCWEVIWQFDQPISGCKSSLIFIVRTSPMARRWRSWSATTASILVASYPGLSYMAPALSAGKNSVVLLLQVSSFLISHGFEISSTTLLFRVSKSFNPRPCPPSSWWSNRRCSCSTSSCWYWRWGLKRGKWNTSILNNDF